MDAVRRVRFFSSDVLGDIGRAFRRRTETYFSETSSSSSIAGAGMIVVRRFGQYAIVRAASSSSSSIPSVASLPAVLSPHLIQRSSIPSVASLPAVLSPHLIQRSSIPSVASLPAVLSHHLIQRLSSEVSIVTACVQASHPSTRAYPLAAGLGHPSLCSQSLPRRSSTYHHHVATHVNTLPCRPTIAKISCSRTACINRGKQTFWSSARNDHKLYTGSQLSDYGADFVRVMRFIRRMHLLMNFLIVCGVSLRLYRTSRA